MNFLKICDVIIKRTGKDIRKSNDEILSQLGIVEVIDIQIPNGEYLNSSKSAQGIMRSLAGYFIRLGKHTNEDLLGSLYCTRTGNILLVILVNFKLTSLFCKIDRIHIAFLIA